MGRVIFLNEIVRGNKMNIEELALVLLRKRECTHKKLQKLCYYAQALHLAVFGTRLVNVEFEAWRHGPVCPELYNKYRVYGSKTIEVDKENIPNINEDDEKFINLVNVIYGELTADQLETLTHSEDPWIQAREGTSQWESCNNIISDESMRVYYRNLLKQNMK